MILMKSHLVLINASIQSGMTLNFFSFKGMFRVCVMLSRWNFFVSGRGCSQRKDMIKSSAPGRVKVAEPFSPVPNCCDNNTI